MYWIAFGDVHERTAMAAHIPGIAEAEGVIISGDLTNHGGPAEARAVFEDIAKHNPHVVAQIGNMDTKTVESFLTKQGANIHLRFFDLFPEAQGIKIGAFGIGYSTPTPFRTPSEVSEEQMNTWLSEIKTKIAEYDTIVAIIHTPPLDTRTDIVGGGSHVGSAAVRAFLEDTQPAICITGHIHESVAEDVIGATRVINPGMLSQGGYVRIELVGGELSAKLLQVPR